MKLGPLDSKLFPNFCLWRLILELRNHLDCFLKGLGSRADPCYFLQSWIRDWKIAYGPIQPLAVAEDPMMHFWAGPMVMPSNAESLISTMSIMTPPIMTLSRAASLRAISMITPSMRTTVSMAPSRTA